MRPLMWLPGSFHQANPGYVAFAAGPMTIPFWLYHINTIVPRGGYGVKMGGFS